jgi:hypothetical protein
VSRPKGGEAAGVPSIVTSSRLCRGRSNTAPERRHRGEASP